MSETYELIAEIKAMVGDAISKFDQLTNSVKRQKQETDSLSKSFQVAAGVMIRDFVNTAMRSTISSVGRAADAFTEYELTLTRIIGATSATGDEAVQLSKDLADVSEAQTDLGYSAREASAALESLVKAGLDGEDASKALRAALSLARIEGVDTAEAANYLVQTLTQFNLTADQSSEALDLISKAADAGIGTATDYAAGLSNAGASAASLGFSLEETLGALVILDKTFGSATESGTFLNMLFKDLIAKSEDLGISLYNTDGSMKSLDQIVTQLKDNVEAYGSNQEAVNEYLSVFDVRAQRAVVGLLNYDGSLSDTVGSMEEARDVQDKVNMVMETSAGKMAKVQAELENVSLEMGAMAAQTELAWKQFALSLGPIGAVADALGPSMLQGAMTGVTMMLPTIWKYLGETTVQMGMLSISAKALAVDIAAGVGAFTAVYGILQSLPAESRSTAAALAVVGGTLVAATAAAIAFYTSISAGTLAPVIVAGVGAAIAGVTVALQDAGASAEDFDKKIDSLGSSISGLTSDLTKMRDKAADQMRQLLLDIEEYNGLILLDEAKTKDERLEIHASYNRNVAAINEADYDTLLSMFDEYAAEQGMSAEDFYKQSLEDLGASLQEQLNAYDTYYDGLVAEEELRHEEAEQELYDYWMSRINAEQTLQGEVIEAYRRYYEDLRSEAQDAYENAVAAAQENYDQQLFDLEGSLNNLLSEYGFFYSDTRTETERFYDDAIATVNAFYDEQLAEMQDRHRVELDEIRDRYADELAVVEQGLQNILDARNAYMNELELNYLKEKQALDEKYVSTLEAVGEYENHLLDLETEYNAKRLTANEQNLTSINSEFNGKKAELFALYMDDLVNYEYYQAELERLDRDYRETREQVRGEFRQQELQYEEDYKDDIVDIKQRESDELNAKQEEQNAEIVTLKEQQNKAIEEVAALLQPALETIAENLATALIDAMQVLADTLVGINLQEKDDIIDIYGDWETEATTFSNNMWGIEVGSAQARTAAINAAYSNMVGNFVGYAEQIQAMIALAAQGASAAEIAGATAANIQQGATYENPITQGYYSQYPEGEQPLYDYAKSAYSTGDYATYLGALWEMVRRGYITEQERIAYSSQVPSAAEGAIFTRPTITSIAEREPEVALPLSKLPSVLGSIGAVGQPSVTINAPLVVVEGSADERTVRLAVQEVERVLRNIIFEATSTNAPATHKRIRTTNLLNVR
jgi:TP901 family phage tail tape measure protein